MNYRKVVIGFFFVATLYVGFAVLLNFLFYDATVLRSVMINKWQCIECEYVNTDRMQIKAIKKIAFQANYVAMRRPKGLAKFPDGGVPLYLKVDSRPFLLDMETQSLQQLDKPLDWDNSFDALRDLRKHEPSALIDALDSERSLSEDAFLNSPLFTLRDPQTGKAFTVIVKQLGFDWRVPITMPLFGYNGLRPQY